MGRANIRVAIFLVFILAIVLSVAVFGSNRRFIVGDEPADGPEGTDHCCTYDTEGVANCFLTTIEGCTKLGGYHSCEIWSNNTNPPEEVSLFLNEDGTEADPTLQESITPVKEYPMYPVANKNTDPFLIKLMAQVKASGIGGTEYNGPDKEGPDYVCHHFADDLQIYLRLELDSDGMPYDTTYTIVRVYRSGQGAFSNQLFPKEAHTYVDIHKDINGDGIKEILFIEAQSGGPGEDVIFPVGGLEGLDASLDNKITAHYRQKYFADAREITERHPNPDVIIVNQINIYDSKANAKSFGVKFDDVKEEVSCSDSDGGLNAFTSGFVQASNGTTFFDYCATSSLVNEYYCANNDVAYSFLPCPVDHICSNGACTSTTSSTTSTSTSSTSSIIDSPGFLE